MQREAGFRSFGLRVLGLLKSSPMRQALWLSLLFLLTSALSLGVTYYVAHNAQERAIQDSLIQDMISFRATPSAQALAVLVNAQTSETDPRRRLLSYRHPGGRVIAGNAAITQKDEGFRLVVLGADPTPVQGSFLLLSERIHGGLLTIAQSAKPLRDLRETFLRVFLFSLLPTITIAVLGGVLLARRAARTLADLDAVLSRLTSGELKARVDPESMAHGDLARIGDSVNRMAAAQENSMAALKQVSADIAHDLKSPIQRVAVQLADLQQIEGLPAEARQIADQTIVETQSIVETFQSLLQIAQLEGGSPKSRFVPTDLGAIAATFAEIYEPVAEEEGRRLTLSLPDQPVWVLGDKGLLGQMLANLVENALRHTPEGSDIAISVSQNEQGVALTLRDHGPGIPEGEQQNVLRRLYRLEQSRTTPGSGLGLSLVQAIADLHGAGLALENADPGLRVRLSFAAATL
ncbi:ATP-binding protein [Pseudophaeobacter sp.]|uniref:sensor histidine kinase n=1 Tax=Pseudophaeobacter sp. TaxID=1971739 RepID=UPI00329A0A3B